MTVVILNNWIAEVNGVKIPVVGCDQKDCTKDGCLRRDPNWKERDLYPPHPYCRVFMSDGKEETK